MASKIVLTGNHIRNARQLFKVTLEQLAQATGLSLSMVERFQRTPGPIKGMNDKIEAVQVYFVGRGLIFTGGDGVVKSQTAATSNTVLEIRILLGMTQEMFADISGVGIEIIKAIERRELLLTDEPPHAHTIQQLVYAARYQNISFFQVPSTDDVPTLGQPSDILVSDITIRRLWLEAPSWIQQYREESLPWAMFSHLKNGSATCVRPGLVRLVPIVRRNDETDNVVSPADAVDA